MLANMYCLTPSLKRVKFTSFGPPKIYAEYMASTPYPSVPSYVMHAAIVSPGETGSGDRSSAPLMGSHAKAWRATLSKFIESGSHSVTNGLIGLLVGDPVGSYEGEPDIANDGRRLG